MKLNLYNCQRYFLEFRFNNRGLLYFGCDIDVDYVVEIVDSLFSKN